MQFTCEECGKLFEDAYCTNRRFCSLHCYGQANGRERASVPRHVRFWSHVDTSADCWLWTANRQTSGYGLFWDGTRFTGAHRYAYRSFVGDIPEGYYVLHRCDVKLCVRPEHLFVGTAMDNVKDKLRKGRESRGDTHGMRLHPERVTRGSAHPASKLNEQAIREIRSRCRAGEYQDQVASEFGVCQAMISKIVRRKAWAHVRD